MSFYYEEYQMLELFDSEVIIDKEAKIARYKIASNHNFIFSVYLSPYDGDVVLSLKQQKSEILIFEVGLSNINKLKVDKEKQGEIKLVFYKEGYPDPLVIIQIKPSISLSCNF